jgi:hypothetical protein
LNLPLRTWDPSDMGGKRGEERGDKRGESRKEEWQERIREGNDKRTEEESRGLKCM